jgi:hypothetical protein
MPAKSNDNGFLFKRKNGGRGYGPVRRSAIEDRFRQLAMVFGLTPWRQAKILRLS